jgi:hypothetical protein
LLAGQRFAFFVPPASCHQLHQPLPPVLTCLAPSRCRCWECHVCRSRAMVCSCKRWVAAGASSQLAGRPA